MCVYLLPYSIFFLSQNEVCIQFRLMHIIIFNDNDVIVFIRLKYTFWDEKEEKKMVNL